MADLGDTMNALVLADPGATQGEPSQGPTEATAASTAAPRPAPTRPAASTIIVKAIVTSSELLANPGATPGAQVGTTAWMEPLFPPREGNYILTFGEEKGHPVSFSKEFLTQHFEFFAACFSSPTMENEEMTINLAEMSSDAFAVILAWLLVGAYPKIPIGGPSQAKLITDHLAAIIAADFLGLKTRPGFNLVLMAEMRQILGDDRVALQWTHLETVFAETFPDSSKECLEIFAAAAVKPFLCGWMRDAKVKTIEASIAGQDIKKDVFKFKATIRHYEQLMTHLDYQTEVFKQVQQTIRNSKRLNKLPIGKIHWLYRIEPYADKR
ncbi:hypothetical protein F5X68DRAFT_259549 [Plectosphaerella plurivora]|uniref:BTB domain-containing protein n=1 Tax=Plectosphaerella plurivora TaxID=936078 RepID=A0A9P8VH18_9PEZI|nr:hypothetical protein F5X68DRAFT_259549 [Plectosphaerella plurivora]